MTPALDPSRTWLAQLSDLHLLAPGATPDGRPPAEWYHEVPQRWRLALSELSALEVELAALVLTGDLCDGARDLEYELLAELLAELRWPLVATPGNHDRGARERDLFAASPTAIPGWNLAPLDTSACHEISPAELEEALRLVRATPPPALHPTHSPLVDAGNFVDAYSLRSAELLAALAASGGPRLVLAGHTHKARFVARAGVYHLGAPSLAYGIEDEVGYLLIGLQAGQAPEVWRRVLPGPSRRLGGEGRVMAGSWTRERLEA